ncbi:MAG: hypothetical protein NC926_03605 [Candidatus Omnitrophica bacterium]|nr:hypothetical protein [Candidatus Omnitrophota bacterium]MCM8807030.1 hypothetical protein [Candidatus Omnitrophota bacterium]
MIKITIDFGAFIYLLSSVIILFLWFFGERKEKFKKKEEDFLWQCPLCFFEYIDSKNKEISRCPQCKTLFKKGEKW